MAQISGACKAKATGSGANWAAGERNTRNLREPCYPLVNIQKAIENGHRNSRFTHSTWWFSILMLVYQRLSRSQRYQCCEKTHHRNPPLYQWQQWTNDTNDSNPSPDSIERINGHSIQFVDWPQKKHGDFPSQTVNVYSQGTPAS